jgi:leucyl/phenylalanyl-tRNA--protein transferase
MNVIQFPDPRRTSDDGVVGFGGSLEWQNLRAAYQLGIFPWPIEDYPLPWFCPKRRAILRFAELHVPRSLAKARRKSPFRFSIDEAFERVIANCAVVPRPGQDGTWITDEVIEGYVEFHERGFAHSVEVWEGEELVGGVYGVDTDGAFSGESMFHLRENASKLALLFLFEHLQSRGLDWMDLQMMTPHMKVLGAVEISRNRFLDLLAATRARGLKLFD